MGEPVTRCPACGSELEWTGKDTMSGREIREWRCPKCGKEGISDMGKALWQALSDEEGPPVK